MPVTDQTISPPPFPLRSYDVEVCGFGTQTFLAKSSGAALADAWRSDVFNGYTFGEFLRGARCRLSEDQPKPDIITVSGKQCWGLGHNGQYVKLVYFDGDCVLNAHPLDVLPVSYRPKMYRFKGTS